MPSETTKDIFCRLLTAMWLRPERALYEAHILSKVSKFISPHFDRNSLEFGCLDGVPTFGMLGGIFSDDFDDYHGIPELNATQANNSRLQDTFKNNQNIDFFENFQPLADISVIKTSPNSSFNFGISHKPSHIERAERLGIYEKLWSQKLSEPLPLDNGTLGLIYAPMLFWVPIGDLPSTIKELCRCSENGGRLVTTFPKENYKTHLLLSKIPNVENEWRRAIDGGSSKNLSRNNLGVVALERLFLECGYRVEKIEETVPVRVAQIYEIGFRAMFPVFLKMRMQLSKLSNESLLEIKAHWIATVSDFLCPLCEEDTLDDAGRKPTWYVLSLIKK